jgi:hypothetical protein
MLESHNKLIMEIAGAIGLNRMGEDIEDEAVVAVQEVRLH